MENKFLIVTCIVFSVSVLGLAFRDDEANQSKLKTILYLLVGSLLIGSAAILGNKAILGISDTLVFYLLMVWALAIGILHLLFKSRFLPWCSGNKFWAELALTTSMVLLGAAFFMVVANYCGKSQFTRVDLASLLFFTVPFLFFSTYLLYLDIPVKVLRIWKYPVDKHIDDPTDREMASPYVVAFEFKKKPDDENMTVFRAKAPKEMVFGKLFYYFINDYNTRNPDETIEFLDANSNPANWIFYFKPKWFSSIRYIDPQETNSFNLIRENSVIVCKRVTEN